MKNHHLNIIAYALTFFAVTLYVCFNGNASTAKIVTSAVLMLLLLIAVSIKGWSDRFGKKLPIFAMFWGMIYVILPIENGLHFSGMDHVGRMISELLNVLNPPWLLLAMLVAIFALLKFIKDRSNAVMILVRYALVGAFFYIINIATYRSIEESVIGKWALFMLPVLIGSLCLIHELEGSLNNKIRPCMAIFILCSSTYYIAVNLFGNGELLQRLNMLSTFAQPVIILCLAATSDILLILDEVIIERDGGTIEKIGATSQGVQILLWIVFNLLTLVVFPKCNNIYITLIGIPLANLAYNFYLIKHKDMAPTEKAFEFNWKAWSVLLCVLIALGGLANKKAWMFAVLAVLALVYYICLQIIKTPQRSDTVMNCFYGIAPVIIWFCIKTDKFDLLSVLIALLLAAFWCIIVKNLKKVSHNWSGIYAEEYAAVVSLSKFAPAIILALVMINTIFI